MGSRNLPARSTRGKRMNQLVGDDALVDEEFWKMDMFNEEAEDEEYKSEAEEEDVIDADFDNPEEQESEEEVEADKEKKEKKRMAYVDPKSKKAPKKRKNTSSEVTQPKTHNESDALISVDEKSEAGKDENGDENKAKKRRKSKPKAIDVTIDESSEQDPSTPSTPSSTRKSTRAVAVQRAVEREKERVETEKKRSLRPKRKSPIIVRRITQEELLEEAKETEIFNTESLKYILSMEEEKKKMKEAPAIIGPVVKYYSKDGKTCMCFDELPSVLQSVEPPTMPPKQTCPITGLPAKYRDPKTGVCYANLEAFKTLRTNELLQKEAEYNAQIAQLTVALQESRYKKDMAQNTPQFI